MDIIVGQSGGREYLIIYNKICDAWLFLYYDAYHKLSHPKTHLVIETS